MLEHVFESTPFLPQSYVFNKISSVLEKWYDIKIR